MISYLTNESSCVIFIIIARHSHSVEIVKQIIIAHQKLFVDIYLTDSPEIEAILRQMIHGKPQHKSIMLYQYLLESFLLAGGGDQSNQGYYAKQRVKPTFNGCSRPLTRLIHEGAKGYLSRLCFGGEEGKEGAGRRWKEPRRVIFR